MRFLFFFFLNAIKRRPPSSHDEQQLFAGRGWRSLRRQLHIECRRRFHYSRLLMIRFCGGLTKRPLDALNCFTCSHFSVIKKKKKKQQLNQPAPIHFFLEGFVYILLVSNDRGGSPKPRRSSDKSPRNLRVHARSPSSRFFSQAEPGAAMIALQFD